MTTPADRARIKNLEDQFLAMLQIMSKNALTQLEHEIQIRALMTLVNEQQQTIDRLKAESLSSN